MYTRRIRVMPSDVGDTGRMKLRSLLDYFQDTAGLAVEDIEGTTTELLARGYAWVLMKYEIYFHAPMPKLDTDFVITTFHDPKHGYNTLRVFQVHSGGELIVSAKTSWLLVDVRTGRPVKPLAHIPGIDSRDNEDIPPDFREIPDIPAVIKSVNIPVMPHDLDYNGHVNNAVYFAWVADNLPGNSGVRAVYAAFRSGARPGENITLEYGGSDAQTVCRLMRPGQNKPSAQFLTERGEIS